MRLPRSRRALLPTAAAIVGLLAVNPIAASAEYVADGSFETAINGGGHWSEGTSAGVFATLFCNDATCGTGGGAMVPRSGGSFVWFGGFPTPHTAFFAQDVAVPAGRATVLSFWLRTGAPRVGTTLRVSVGGDEIWAYDEEHPTDHDPTGHPYADYTRIEVPIPGSAFDGDPAPLRFDFSSPGASDAVNYALDDVSLVDGPGADASVTLSPSSATAHPGDTVTYDVEVANAGPDAADVSLRGALPPTLELVSAGGPDLDCPVPATPGDDLVCDAGTLASGGSADGRIEVRATTVGSASLTLSAAVGPLVNDPDPSNDSATASLEVVPAPEPEPEPQPEVPSAEAPAAPTAPSTPLPPVTTPEPPIAPVCLSERRFTTRLLRGRGGPGLRIPVAPSRARIVSARVAGPKGWKARKARRTRSAVDVDLRGAPVGRYTLRARVRIAASGRSKARTVTVTRTYRTCTPGR